MNPNAVITLEIEGLRPSEVERLRAMLHLLILRGILNIKKGQMTLHFSDQGNIETVETTNRWRLADQRHEERLLASDRVH